MRFALVAAAFTLAAAPAFAADPVVGEWITADGGGKVRIAPCPGKPDRLCGHISGSLDAKAPEQRDSYNPNPALRGRSLLGLQILSDFKPVASGRWTGGKIYDPRAGKTYDSKLSISPNGALKVEGCIAVICQAQTWRRS